jgi:hypothetical protein
LRTSADAAELDDENASKKLRGDKDMSIKSRTDESDDDEHSPAGLRGHLKRGSEKKSPSTGALQGFVKPHPPASKLWGIHGYQGNIPRAKEKPAFNDLPRDRRAFACAVSSCSDGIFDRELCKLLSQSRKAGRIV